MHQFEIKQDFEVHVTIKPTENTEPFIKLCESFTEYANSLAYKDSFVYSCKPIIIVLPAGVYKQQPMCSMFVSATLQQAIEYGNLFSKFLKDNFKEYEFARNKVEARFKNVENINLDLLKNNSYYWEFHFKLLFNRDEDKIQEFRYNLERNFPMARLSRSALSKYEINKSIKTSRVVTLRLYSGDKKYAKAEYDRIENFILKKELHLDYGIELVPGTEMELSVYDSNVQHDIGWIPMESNRKILKFKWGNFLKILFTIVVTLKIINYF